MAAVSGDNVQCKVGDVIVRVDSRYFQAMEVETLLGAEGKAKRKLGWTQVTTPTELVSEMVESDCLAAKRDSLVKQAGFQAATTTSWRTCRLRECPLSIAATVEHCLGEFHRHSQQPCTALQ